MAELEAALEHAAAGDGRMVLIAGEPGIGKSQLADEIAHAARHLGATVVWGRCWEAGGAPAYWPWVQCLRSLLRTADQATIVEWLSSSAADLVTLLPELSDLAPELSRPFDLVHPDTARFRLFESTVSFLRACAAEQPIVVVLDDLHAADTPSLLLLRFAAAQLSGARVLVVSAYRNIDPAVDTDLAETVAAVERVPSTHRLTLTGLGHEDVARLIEASTGVEPAPGVVAAVHRETEGNPLFVGEFSRLIDNEDLLSSADVSMPLVIPETVKEVIGRRLDRLSEACRRVLVLASVIGRDFDLDTLSTIAERSPDELLEILEEATAARVVAETPGAVGSLRFAHALIRLTLYEETSSLRRARLHRGIAEALETVHEESLDEHVASLAYHAIQAGPEGDLGRALEYASRAGLRALELLAYEEAARWFREALAALDRLDDPATRCELHIMLGDALSRAGDRDGATRNFSAAADLARAIGAPDALARAALGYGGRFTWWAARDDPTLRSMLEEALTAMGPSDDPLRVRLLSRLVAGPLRDDPDIERRRRLAGEAVAMAERLDNDRSIAYALDGLVYTLASDEVGTRLAVIRRLIDVAERAGDRERVLSGHSLLFNCQWEIGDASGARAEADITRSLAQALHEPGQLWLASAEESILALYEGRLDDAERLIERSRRIGERAERYNAELSYDLQRFWLRFEQGRLEEVGDEILLASARYQSYPTWSCLLPYFQIHMGLSDEAAAGVQRLALDRFGSLPQNESWLFGLCLLGEVVSDVGSDEDAEILYDALRPFAGRVGLSPEELSYGAVAYPLGLLARRRGSLEDAEAHLSRAIVINERMGGRPAAGRARRALKDLRSRGTNIEPEVAAHRIEGVLRREGEIWSLSLGRESGMLRDSKGVRYLRALLSQPGQEVHAIELVRAVEGVDSATMARAGDAGPALDERAKREYRARIEELQTEIDEAESWHDSERAAKAREELDFLVHALAEAVGLSGRDRPAASDAERARVNVTRAIKATLERIEGACPSIGAHLRATVRTGQFCAYEPDPLSIVRWMS
jgi:tetratricopeptide (TPR) repeat protein